MTMTSITGTFDVALAPTDTYAQGKEGMSLARMTIDKTFHGDLSATSQGEMLSARTPTPNSAGYVAIEQVSGELNGKVGSFVLQHFGTMAQGQDNLVIEVVPGSGSGELEGISGTMHIRIEQGIHYYDFNYSL